MAHFISLLYIDTHSSWWTVTHTQIHTPLWMNDSTVVPMESKLSALWNELSWRNFQSNTFGWARVRTCLNIYVRTMLLDLWGRRSSLIWRHFWGSDCGFRVTIRLWLDLELSFYFWWLELGKAICQFKVLTKMWKSCGCVCALGNRHLFFYAWITGIVGLAFQMCKCVTHCFISNYC